MRIIYSDLWPDNKCLSSDYHKEDILWSWPYICPGTKITPYSSSLSVVKEEAEPFIRFSFFSIIVLRWIAWTAIFCYNGILFIDCLNTLPICFFISVSRLAFWPYSRLFPYRCPMSIPLYTVFFKEWSVTNHVTFSPLLQRYQDVRNQRSRLPT